MTKNQGFDCRNFFVPQDKTIGDTFEDLCADLLLSLGFSIIQRSGIGPDSEIDLVVEEPLPTISDPRRRFIWVVQCKHKKANLSHRDIGNFQNLVYSTLPGNIKVNGVLIITDTHLTRTLQRQIDNADANNKNSHRFIYWNHRKLETLLLRDPRCAPVLSQYYGSTQENNFRDLLCSYNKALFEHQTSFVEVDKEYIPLYVRSYLDFSAPVGPKRKRISKEEATQAVRPFKRVAILGTAGQGKTTILRRISCIHSSKLLQEDIESEIPIFLPFIAFHHNDFKDFIRESLNSVLKDSNDRFSKEDINSLVENYHCLFLCDGLDEIQLKYKNNASYIVQSFMNDYAPRSRFVFTCRNMESSNWLSVFSCEDAFEVLELTLPVVQEHITRFIPAGLQVWNELTPRVRELLKTPIILSILKTTVLLDFDDTGNLSIEDFSIVRNMLNNKGRLYRQYFIQQWLKRENDEKRRHVPSIEEKKVIYRKIAYETFRNRTGEINKTLLNDTLLQHCAAATRRTLSSIVKSVLLDNLIVPNQMESDMSLEVNETYRFKHYSFLEYFAAEEICAQIPSGIDLKSLMDDPAWDEVFVFLAGLINSKDVLTEMLQHLQVIDCQLAARCVAAANEHHVDQSLQKEIIEQAVSYIRSPHPHLRRQALYTLLEIRTNDAVQAVTVLMKEADSDLRSKAATGLGHIMAIECIPDLFVLLGDEHPSVRQTAIMSLIDMREYLTINDQWIKAIFENKNDKLRERAVELLGHIPEHQRDRALEILRKIEISNQGGLIQAKHIESLIRLRDYETVIPLVVKVFSQDSNGGTGALLDQVYKSLEIASSEKLENVLVDGMKNNTKTKARHFANAISHLQKIMDPKRLLQCIDSENEKIIKPIVTALSRINSEEVILCLLRLLEHPSGSIREFVVDVLAGMDREMVSRLFLKSRACRDSRNRPWLPYVRETTFLAHRLFGDDGILPIMDDLVKQENKGDIAGFLYCLCQLSLTKHDVRKKIFDFIQTLQNSGDKSYLEKVAQALGALALPECVPMLLSLLSSSQCRVRAVAVIALGRCNARQNINEIQKLLHDEELIVQIRAVETLARMGDSSGIKVALKIIKEDIDKHADGRKAFIGYRVSLIESMSRYVDEPVVECLCQIYRKPRVCQEFCVNGH